jgi:kumamolisin
MADYTGMSRPLAASTPGDLQSASVKKRHTTFSNFVQRSRIISDGNCGPGGCNPIFNESWGMQAQPMIRSQTLMTPPHREERLPGSERHRPLDAKRLKPTDPKQVLSVTVHMRRRLSASPLPSQEFWAATPPMKRSYLSRRQFLYRHGSSRDDIEMITQFLRSHHLTVTQADASQRIVIASGTVKQINKAFGVDLGDYQRGSEIYRGREGFVHLPKKITEVVTGVFGLDNRRMAYRQSSRTARVTISPLEIAKLYRFPGVQKSIKQQTIGLLEFSDPVGIGTCGYLPPDIHAYFAGNLGGHMGLRTPSVTDVVVSGPGNKPGGPNDPEVAIDIEVAGAAAQGAKLAVYFSTWDENGWILALKRAVHPRKGDPTPTVISISWLEVEFGANGNLTWSPAALSVLNESLQEAAAFGITVLAASGDLGSDCQQGDGKAHVYYPSSDPWVTTCGGTSIKISSQTSFSETTWNTNGVTGGGVSDYFPLPSWQEGTGVPPSVNRGSHIGRGLPDIAGYANGYTIVQGGTKKKSARGTSEVAPLYAGLVAVINATIGKQIGYLNPTLYSLRDTNVFRDICDGVTNSFNGSPGYRTIKGWDGCTGLGSIDGTALLTQLQKGSDASAPRVRSKRAEWEARAHYKKQS